MLVEVKVPRLAESVPDATLLAWHRQPGDKVKRGDNLIDLETDKVTLEVAAPADGVLREIVKRKGETALSDEVLAIIDTEAPGVAKLASAPVQAPVRVLAAVPAEEPKLSPAVRKLVAEHALDTAAIPATGKDGRLTKADVLQHLSPGPAAAPVPNPPPPSVTPPAEEPAAGTRAENRVPMSRLRRTAAERLLAAQRESAILTTFNEVNMQPVTEIRTRYRDDFERRHGIRLGFMSFFAKACVAALKTFPIVNASVEGSDIVYHPYCDLGVAVSSPRGLVVPIVRDVERLSFAEIERKVREFGDKARESRLSIDELSGGTFTITNGGIFGSLMSTPIINPPQSAILGMHKIQDRPIAENGQIAIRPMMYLALSYDHRIIDGREAVQFLVMIKQQLEDPARMLLQI